MYYYVDMELTSIVAIVGLVIYITVKDWLHHKERVAMERIKKADSLSEVEYVFGEDKEQEPLEESHVVDLENIPPGEIPEGPE